MTRHKAFMVTARKVLGIAADLITVASLFLS